MIGFFILSCFCQICIERLFVVYTIGEPRFQTIQNVFILNLVDHGFPGPFRHGVDKVLIGGGGNMRGHRHYGEGGT